jgi:CHRD domain-containing protein
MNALRIVALALTASALALPVRAEMVNLGADLSARNEVPPNTSSGNGRADIRLDTTSGNLSWTINYSGLTAPLSAAHFHGPAAAGANAGVIVPIANAGASAPLTGMATLSPTQVADVLAGRWYVNVHTSTNPGGEIRGQVVRR